jgi:hypothetical protein
VSARLNRGAICTPLLGNPRQIGEHYPRSRKPTAFAVISKYSSATTFPIPYLCIFLLISKKHYRNTQYSNMSTLAAQKATTKTVLDAYNAWDLEAILAFRTSDCQQQVLPASMGRPAMNNTQYRERLNQIMPWFRKFTVTPISPRMTTSNRDSDGFRSLSTQKCMTLRHTHASCMRRVRRKRILDRMRTSMR